MAPYIAALILLIVSVLFMVYQRVETFQGSAITITKDTPLKEIIAFDTRKLKEMKEIKEKVDSSPPFDGEVTEKELSELEITWHTSADKGLQYERPLSKAISKKLEKEIAEGEKNLEYIQSFIQSGKVTESSTFAKTLKAMGAPEVDFNILNAYIKAQVAQYEKRMAFIKSKLSASGTGLEGLMELTCPGGRIPFTQNGSVYCRNLNNTRSPALVCPPGTSAFLVLEEGGGKFFCLPPTHSYVVNPGSKITPGQVGCKENEVSVMNVSNNSQKCFPKESSTGSIAGVSTDDLFNAVGGVQQAIKASKPAEIEKVQALAPEQTVLSTREMEERIAKSVASQLKDSLMVERATKNVMDEMPCPYASYQSEAIAQGTEYAQARPNPGPDMSEYIRKDSIPCWNCSLP